MKVYGDFIYEITLGPAASEISLKWSSEESIKSNVIDEFKFLWIKVMNDLEVLKEIEEWYRSKEYVEYLKSIRFENSECKEDVEDSGVEFRVKLTCN